MSKCKFIKSDKSVCKAEAIQNDEFCFWHSEKMREKRQVATSEGGRNPKNNNGNQEEISIKSTNDILMLLEQTMNDLRRNKTSTRIANALGYLSGICLKAIEQGDLAKRLEVVEYALKVRKQDS